MAAAIDRRRHARQLLLAEIGEQGQARLCATRVSIARGADARAAEVARAYLQGAGMQVVDVDAQAEQNRNASHRPQAAPARAVPVAGPAGVRALAGRPELEEAAAAMVGAFAAVEAIKHALGLPPGALATGLSLGPEG